MPLITQGKTNWKYILIVLILAVIAGGGIFCYLRYFEKEIESLTKFPEIKKPEKIIKKLEVEYKTFSISNSFGKFSIDYPSSWETIPKGEMGILGGIEVGWKKGNFPDICIETIEVYSGATLKIFGPKLYEEAIESNILQGDSNIISQKSKTINSEYGKKYTWSYNFINKKTLIESIVWSVVFNCGDHDYLVIFSCSAKEATEDKKEIADLIIDSIKCEEEK